MPTLSIKSTNWLICWTTTFEWLFTDLSWHLWTVWNELNPNSRFDLWICKLKQIEESLNWNKACALDCSALMARCYQKQLVNIQWYFERMQHSHEMRPKYFQFNGEQRLKQQTGTFKLKSPLVESVDMRCFLQFFDIPVHTKFLFHEWSMHFKNWLFSDKSLPTVIPSESLITNGL